MQFSRYGSASFLIKPCTYILTRIIRCRIEYSKSIQKREKFSTTIKQVKETERNEKID